MGNASSHSSSKLSRLGGKSNILSVGSSNSESNSIFVAIVDASMMGEFFSFSLVGFGVNVRAKRYASNGVSSMPKVNNDCGKEGCAFGFFVLE